MRRTPELWITVANRLNRGETLALLLVAESSGSSPGRQGFLMVVASDGAIYGSIGGGIMEMKWVELAKKRLQQGDYTALLRKQIHDKSASSHRSGMICSGSQTVVLFFLHPQDAPVAARLLQKLKKSGQAALRIEQTEDSRRFEVIRMLQGIPMHMHFSPLGKNSFAFTCLVGWRHRMYIVGGGHCALALSEIMSGLDFYVCLFDDRPGLSTLQKNRFAHEIRLLNDYREVGQLIPGGSDTYIAVMTTGYRTDEIAIRQLIDKDCAYLGVLGSRAKIRTLLASLLDSGCDPERLQRLYAPVGLAIHSRTPAEIAVSIAAQIIAVRNRPE